MARLSFILMLGFLFILKNHFKAQNTRINLEDIWTGKYDQRLLNVKTLNKTNRFAFIKYDSNNLQTIVSLDFETGKLIDTIFTNQIKKEKDTTPTTFTFFEDFEFSPDDKKILIKAYKERFFTNSTKELCFIWDVDKKTLTPVISNGKISHATFSPTSDKLAYIFDNNIYIKDLISNEIKKITIDGKDNEVLYGMCDNLYETAFGLGKMLKWSNSGDKLAFSRFDEKIVKSFPITIFENNYPQVKNLPYPQAGEMVPKVDVFVHLVNFGVNTMVDLGINPNQYMTGFNFSPNGNSIYVQKLNRKQNFIEVIKSDIKTGTSKLFYSEQSPNYIKVFPNNIFIDKTETIIFWLSDKDGHNHLYDIAKGNAIQITKGNYDVIDFVGFDESNNLFYYSSNEEAPTEKNFYSNNLLDLRKKNKLTDFRGWNEAYFTKNTKYLLAEMSDINNPTSYQMYSTTGKALHEKLIENKTLKLKLQNLNFRKIDIVSAQWNDNVSRRLLYLKSAKPNVQNKTLVYIYGGPDKQLVQDRWGDRSFFALRLIADSGYNVVVFDPIGTPGRGAKFNKAGFENIGEIAAKDLLYLKNYLYRNYRTDTNNIALMGWSYGGFITSFMATKYPTSFKSYIAVAPVTDWFLYDNAFSERYLRAPSEAPENYINNSPVTYAENYKKNLLLIHGTADENVHLQNSMRLSKQLIKFHKAFDQQFYPDYLHDINDADPNNARIHLFQKVIRYLGETLK